MTTPESTAAPASTEPTTSPTAATTTAPTTASAANGSEPPKDPVFLLNADGPYVVPQKYIFSKAHLEAFTRSKTHDAILGFIDELNDEIVGAKLSEAGEPSEVSSGQVST